MIPKTRRPALLLAAAATTALTAFGTVLTPTAFASPVGGPLPTAKVGCVAYSADGTCSTAGVVYAVTQVGDTTFVGGSFTQVGGTARANVAAIRADGTLDTTWRPSTNGTVYALAPSADGSTIFLGGGFTEVDGQPRSRLAAVSTTTGDLVTGWGTAVNNNLVRALATDGDDRLYVGGSFGRIGGRSIPRLAAVSQSTGAVDRTFTPTPNNTVRALALSDDGARLHAGGSFTVVGGQSRPGAAELTRSGALTSFAPTEGGVVIAADVSPSGRAYYATTNNRTWAYDPEAGTTPVYRVRTSGDVQAILATDDEVYVGGHFSGFPEAKANRLHLASFGAADGQPSAWNPHVNGTYGVWALGLTRTPASPAAAPRLSVGGDFSVVSQKARRGYARFAL